jgi:DNA-binding NarL/FixJ family response regulator
MLSKISLLIVDDNVSFVGRMISFLKEVDAVGVIHAAYNYDEAYELLDQKPNLVLLDIQMPGKNGMKLLKQIKDSTANCGVIMLTNNTNEYYRHQCKKLGASHFLDKTNEFELVPGIINDLSIRDRQ